MFMIATGTKLVHVPYKGSGQALGDMLAGHVALNFDTMPPVLASIRAGRLHALAVTTPKRVPQLAQIPTMLEAGMTGYEMTNWYGVMAPANTPREIVSKLNAEINRIVALPDAKTRLEDVGTQLDPKSPEQFAEFLRSEVAKYARVVKTANVRVD
jgi:tripartite-type tricarboxylate transporter receptor subunit TctC